MQIAVLLFEGLTALDAVGPYEILSRLPGAEACFVGKKRGPVRTDAGSLALLADFEFTDVTSPHILVVPGGPGVRALLRDETTLAWIRGAHRTTRWTASVCTGSLLLAAAGLMQGVDAATHWAAYETLRELGATPTGDRVVERGKILTAAGVSAGIDMALRLAQRAAGDEVAQAIQLLLEYDPQPPFDTGSPARAPAAVVERARELSRPAGVRRERDASGGR